MGQVLHGCATTTHAITATIRQSQATTVALSKGFGINVKTVEDRKIGPTQSKDVIAEIWTIF